MSGNLNNEPPPPSYEQLFGPSSNNGQSHLSPPVQLPPYPPSFSPFQNHNGPQASSVTAPNRFAPPPVIPMSPPSFVVDDESAMWFNAVDENSDGRITLFELREALINFDGKPFNVRTCHFLVQMFDTNGDGTIDLQEFCALKAYIDKWKKQFDRIDVDRSGNIDAGEFSQALTQLGYQLSPQFSSRVLRIFGNTRNRSSMNFDAFIRSCAFIHSMASLFTSKRQQRTPGNTASPPSSLLSGSVSFNFEEFSRMIFEFALTEDY